MMNLKDNQCSALEKKCECHYRTALCFTERRHNLVDPKGRVIMMLEELLSIQEAQLILTQERDALRSEHEKLKIIYCHVFMACGNQ
jgi:hypothetical protein